MRGREDRIAYSNSSSLVLFRLEKTARDSRLVRTVANVWTRAKLTGSNASAISLHMAIAVSQVFKVMY